MCITSMSKIIYTFISSIRCTTLTLFFDIFDIRNALCPVSHKLSYAFYEEGLRLVLKSLFDQIPNFAFELNRRPLKVFLKGCWNDPVTIDRSPKTFAFVLSGKNSWYPSCTGFTESELVGDDLMSRIMNDVWRRHTLIYYNSLFAITTSLACWMLSWTKRRVEGRWKSPFFCVTFVRPLLNFSIHKKAF